jgi:hypothetical protein
VDLVEDDRGVGKCGQQAQTAVTVLDEPEELIDSRGEISLVP